MAFGLSNALFYSVDVSRSALANLVLGTTDPPALDTVEFERENGGEAIRQLALPRLAGMDEVEIEVAQIGIRSVGRPIEISNFSQRAAPRNQGVFLTLPKPGRLLNVEVQYEFPPLLPGQTRTDHVVIRDVKKSNSGMEGGVPLFADPFLPKPGDMFPDTLAGMSQIPLGKNRFRLILPSVLGDAWLIQLASGDKAVELKPLDAAVTILKVTLDAVPSNVSVLMVTPTAEVPLWANPQMLLPSNEPEVITFTPLAQKELAAELEATKDDELTLPLTLKFRSDTGGALAIVSKSLQGRYVVNAVKELPASLSLSGARVPFVLSAPAGLTPQAAKFRMIAKVKGRELNNASSEPPLTIPAKGLRVTQTNRVAQQIQFQGRLPLVNIRLLLATEVTTEAILELHEDASGAPGALLGAPVVNKLDPRVRGWIDFEVKTPLSFAADLTTLWVTLRVTTGEVLWFASEEAGEGALVSTDKGTSWGSPDTHLTSATAQLVQLFHEVSSPFAKPVIRVDRGNTPVAADLLSNAQTLSEREFLADNVSLPSSVMSFFLQQSGKERVDQRLQLFSRSVLDLRVESASLFYDPFQPGRLEL